MDSTEQLYDDGPSEGDDPGKFFAIVPDAVPDFKQDGEDDDEAGLDERQEALLGWLESAFAQGYSIYLQKIASLLDAPLTADGDPSEALSRALPRLVIDVSGEWREDSSSEDPLSPEQIVDTEEIIFDGDLMATLVDLYIFDGWQPMVRIGRELDLILERLRKLRREAPTAGTPPAWTRDVNELAPWEPAAFLFRLARNAVGQLVRDELAQIETKVGIRLTSQMAEGQTRFAVPAGSLKWKEIKETRQHMRAGSDTPVTEMKTRHQLDDRNLAATYKEALKQAHTCRLELDNAIAELPRFDWETQRYANEVVDLRALYEKSIVRARSLVDAAEKQLKINAPLLLLVLPTLKLGFDKSEDWEDDLYSRVEETRKALADLRDKVKPEVPFTLDLNAGVDVKKQVATWDSLLALDTPAYGVVHGFEQRMAELAVAGLSEGKYGWLPLASEKTLHELVGREEIEKDSLTYVVYAHYVQTLGSSLDQRLRDEEASTTFWTNFSRAAAAASIASLFTAEGAIAAPLLRAATGFADVVLLAQSVWSITSELQRLERLRHQAIAESSSAFEAFGQLGELLAVRQDLLEGLGPEAVLMLLTTLIGNPEIQRAFQLQRTRRALVAWSFYQDIQTVFTTDGTEN